MPGGAEDAACLICVHDIMRVNPEQQTGSGLGRCPRSRWAVCANAVDLVSKN